MPPGGSGRRRLSSVPSLSKASKFYGTPPAQKMQRRVDNRARTWLFDRYLFEGPTDQFRWPSTISWATTASFTLLLRA